MNKSNQKKTIKKKKKWAPSSLQSRFWAYQQQKIIIINLIHNAHAYLAMVHTLLYKTKI